ncbi:MAG: peroxiredoxin [Gammaproteobacteria bacterium]
MSKPEIGKVAPNFKLPATGDQNLELRSLRGKKLVMYFYPKDNTPGCTTESQDFAADYAKFKRAGAEIIGISRDTIASHEKFKAKLDLPFELVSDADEKACSLYDVIKEKNMYGRKVMGIERSTFLIDEKGKLRQEWRKLKVAGHAEEVLAAVKEI